jgi:hypothetical protein
MASGNDEFKTPQKSECVYTKKNLHGGLTSAGPSYLHHQKRLLGVANETDEGGGYIGKFGLLKKSI